MPDACRTPIRIIIDAVNAALARGIAVTTDRYPGVVCASSEPPMWARDPRARAVSPLGAVLLREQPEASDLDPAIAAALGISVIWHLGFELGCAKEDLDPRLSKPPSARLAGEGYIAGIEMRALLHRRTRPEQSAQLTDGET